MNELVNYFSELPFAHHAYGIESRQGIPDKLDQILPRDHFSYVFNKKYDSLKIADVRILKSLQSEKTSKASLFVIEFTLINSESQNALLKILEEPTAQTYFILVFPDAQKLLPTLRSRLEIIKLQPVMPTSEAQDLVVDFVAMSLSQRFDFIKEKTDKKKNPFTKAEVLSFLDTLELVLSRASKVDHAASLEAVFKAKGYVHAKGSSHKMILEMVAITLD